MGSGDDGAVTRQYPHDGAVEKEIDTSTNTSQKSVLLTNIIKFQKELQYSDTCLNPKHFNNVNSPQPFLICSLVKCPYLSHLCHQC